MSGEYSNRRAVMYDDYSESERNEKLTTTEVLESGFSAGLTTNTVVARTAVASNTQVRLLRYNWSNMNTNSARMQVVASTTSYASILDRSFLSGTGEVEREGRGWQDPYLTHEMASSGSLVLRAVPVDTGGSISANMQAMLETQLPEDEL